MRYLTLLLLAVAAFLVVRHLFSRPPAAGGKPPAPPGDMVRCARCGLYLPEDDAVRAGERFYCSPEHRDQDAG
jgi:uncharacterized protein